ncbi:hypothetical protein ASPWEDRAFT_27161 [Aspergillus wentii DTO 134E9]|uniref:Uncharacterized protein n=1 Tax=Aspergillus wentii DTO 134E9 TaxID=1073089 RepID=A0A1L9RSF8_ASPWE|nr:uncharacterized protein ASPWEDRAFT_27161 [Aspergillus wentii DTO 134E9]OJJ37813.1 hypothetical protein ASPWEDRAFT_27161 [Aspergillus wentii DTO 134E9]
MRFLYVIITAFIGIALATPSPEAAADELMGRGLTSQSCAIRGQPCANQSACCVSLWCVKGKCVNQGSGGKRDVEEESTEATEASEASENSASWKTCSNTNPCERGWICIDGICNPPTTSRRDIFEKKACRGEITSCGGKNGECCPWFRCENGYCTR